jgi:RecJ-like exonuclease
MSEDQEENLCGSCSGSGEGRFDGSTCSTCGGSGMIYYGECEYCGNTIAAGKKALVCSKRCLQAIKAEFRGDL